MTSSLPRECRRADERLPLHYYGALGEIDRRALERHLASCAACAARWDHLRRVLSAVDAASAFPREREVDWELFRRETVVRARAAATARAASGTVRWLVRLPFLAAWAAAAALVIAILALGLMRRAPVPTREPHLAALSAESAHVLQTNLARQGAARYLRESRSLLVNLVQAPVRCRKTSGDFDIALEKEKARELLQRKNLYERSLDGMQDQRLADLVAQLEPLLVQVSSLEDCTAARQIRELSKEIDRRQILLRIDLVTREVDGRRFRA